MEAENIVALQSAQGSAFRCAAMLVPCASASGTVEVDSAAVLEGMAA